MVVESTHAVAAVAAAVPLSTGLPDAKPPHAVDDDERFKARRRRAPPEFKKTATMRAFAQDGSFAYNAADATTASLAKPTSTRDVSPSKAGRSLAAAGVHRRKRVPQQRDFESVLDPAQRIEIARQRSQVSFGKHTINLDKTFRTAPGGSARVTLDDSPSHSPQRAGRSSSASFMSTAQVIFAASTGGSSYESAFDSNTGSSTGSSRGLSRQATLRAIAKNSDDSDDGFMSTTSSNCSSTSTISNSSSSSAMMLAAKKKAKKNVSFHSSGECQHDQTSADDRSKSVSNMLSPIHAACRKGDYLVVKHILSFYYGNECMNLVNSSCTCGMTPLQVACDNGHVKIAKLLLRRHAQPNKRGGKKRHHSCIAMACIQKNLDLVELLLQYGATVDEDALVITASSGYDEIVRLLINFRPKRNLTFDIPTQFLHKVTHQEIEASSLNKAASLAVTQDHPEMLLILLGDGKHQASREKVQACALDAAVQADYRLLRALAKQYNASILLGTKDGNACTLLHHAVRNENVKSVSLLIRLGADVHLRDSAGITPLYIACARGQSSIVSVLVEAGAKCVSMGPNDETPLHIAAQENHLACVEILLTHGRAPVDGVTRDLCTALHLASQRGNTQVAECLLDHGAQVNALTIGDETPLLKASRMSQFHTVKLLMSRGAKTHTKVSSENQCGKENVLSMDEVEPHLHPQQHHQGNFADPRVEKTQGEDSIFIAKSNTHTSLKKWIRSVLKNHD
uniref:Uncharacterized protein n=1 Tax=Globisporangium ultimum (strain ATCC 200006 / CBS 805.95 / DAOM BR144) TaxID=431595 RepID=K3WBW8_GLOUD